MDRYRKYGNLLQQVNVIAQLSPDEETKVGAILVDPSDMSIIATGYNGFVRGAPDDQLPKTRPDKYEYMIHAEQNIIAHCAKKGIRTNGCMLFCNISPCKVCTRLLFQAGITEVVCSGLYSDFTRNNNMGDIIIKAEQIPLSPTEHAWILKYAH